MIKITDKILQMDKPNGTFIIFGEHDSEEDFTAFLDLLNKELGADVGLQDQHPYSRSASVTFSSGNATAICQGGIGCAIRIDPEKVDLIAEIVAGCSKIK